MWDMHLLPLHYINLAAIVTLLIKIVKLYDEHIKYDTLFCINLNY